MAGYIEMKFEDTLNCCVCLETVRGVRILPCGHTQCKQCISGCVGANDFGGLFECPECKSSFPIPDVEALPRCAVVNNLLAKIEAMGVDALDRKSPEIRAIFLCVLCGELMADARSLSCGHSHCRKCLAERCARGHQVYCPSCRKVERLPDGGVDNLPINYRINGIIDELRGGGKTKTRPRSSDGGQFSGFGPSTVNGKRRQQQSPEGAGGKVVDEDVEEAKKRAQRAAKLTESRRGENHDVDNQKGQVKKTSSTDQVLVRLPSGKSIPVTVDFSDDTVGDLQKRIHAKVDVHESLQMLSFNGRNLDRSTSTLRQYGVQNHDTVRLNFRLVGGGGC